jgi:hypothetical protein
MRVVNLSAPSAFPTGQHRLQEAHARVREAFARAQSRSAPQQVQPHERVKVLQSLGAELHMRRNDHDQQFQEPHVLSLEYPSESNQSGRVVNRSSKNVFSQSSQKLQAKEHLQQKKAHYHQGVFQSKQLRVAVTTPMRTAPPCTPLSQPHPRTPSVIQDCRTNLKQAFASSPSSSPSHTGRSQPFMRQRSSAISDPILNRFAALHSVLLCVRC